MEGPRGERWFEQTERSHLEASASGSADSSRRLSAPGYAVAVSGEFGGHEWGVWRRHGQVQG